MNNIQDINLRPSVGGLRNYGLKTLPTKLFQGREHFGFKDGISQPFIEGTQALFEDKKKRWGKVPFNGQGTPDDKKPWKPLMPGEFILGYPDETKLPVRRNDTKELWKNGTYLVFRKLSQHVQNFNEFVKTTAKHNLGSDSLFKIKTS